MKRQLGKLIFQTEDVSMYEDKLIDYIPDHTRLGGFITVINNRNGEERWKEWKWYRHDDGFMSNDRDHVINRMFAIAKKLQSNI